MKPFVAAARKDARTHPHVHSHSHAHSHAPAKRATAAFATSASISVGSASSISLAHQPLAAVHEDVPFSMDIATDSQAETHTHTHTQNDTGAGSPPCTPIAAGRHRVATRSPLVRSSSRASESSRPGTTGPEDELSHTHTHTHTHAQEGAASETRTPPPAHARTRVSTSGASSTTSMSTASVGVSSPQPSPVSVYSHTHTHTHTHTHGAAAASTHPHWVTPGSAASAPGGSSMSAPRGRRTGGPGHVHGASRARSRAGSAMSGPSPSSVHGHGPVRVVGGSPADGGMAVAEFGDGWPDEERLIGNVLVSPTPRSVLAAAHSSSATPGLSSGMPRSPLALSASPALHAVPTSTHAHPARAKGDGAAAREAANSSPAGWRRVRSPPTAGGTRMRVRGHSMSDFVPMALSPPNTQRSHDTDGLPSPRAQARNRALVLPFDHDHEHDTLDEGGRAQAAADPHHEPAARAQVRPAAVRASVVASRPVASKLVAPAPVPATPAGKSPAVIDMTPGQAFAAEQTPHVLRAYSLSRGASGEQPPMWTGTAADAPPADPLHANEDVPASTADADAQDAHTPTLPAVPMMPSHGFGMPALPMYMVQPAHMFGMFPSVLPIAYHAFGTLPAVMPSLPSTVMYGASSSPTPPAAGPVAYTRYETTAPTASAWPAGSGVNDAVLRRCVHVLAQPDDRMVKVATEVCLLRYDILSITADTSPLVVVQVADELRREGRGSAALPRQLLRMLCLDSSELLAAHVAAASRSTRDVAAKLTTLRASAGLWHCALRFEEDASINGDVNGAVYMATAAWQATTGLQFPREQTTHRPLQPRRGGKRPQTSRGDAHKTRGCTIEDGLATRIVRLTSQGADGVERMRALVSTVFDAENAPHNLVRSCWRAMLHACDIIAAQQGADAGVKTVLGMAPQLVHVPGAHQECCCFIMRWAPGDAVSLQSCLDFAGARTSHPWGLVIACLRMHERHALQEAYRRHPIDVDTAWSSERGWWLSGCVDAFDILARDDDLQTIMDTADCLTDAPSPFVLDYYRAVLSLADALASTMVIDAYVSASNNVEPECRWRVIAEGMFRARRVIALVCTLVRHAVACMVAEVRRLVAANVATSCAVHEQPASFEIAPVLEQVDAARSCLTRCQNLAACCVDLGRDMMLGQHKARAQQLHRIAASVSRVVAMSYAQCAYSRSLLDEVQAGMLAVRACETAQREPSADSCLVRILDIVQSFSTPSTLLASHAADGLGVASDALFTAVREGANSMAPHALAEVARLFEFGGSTTDAARALVLALQIIAPVQMADTAVEALVIMARSSSAPIPLPAPCTSARTGRSSTHDWKLWVHCIEFMLRHGQAAGAAELTELALAWQPTNGRLWAVAVDVQESLLRGEPATWRLLRFAEPSGEATLPETLAHLRMQPSLRNSQAAERWKVLRLLLGVGYLSAPRCGELWLSIARTLRTFAHLFPSRTAADDPESSATSQTSSPTPHATVEDAIVIALRRAQGLTQQYGDIYVEQLRVPGAHVRDVIAAATVGDPNYGREWMQACAWPETHAPSLDALDAVLRRAADGTRLPADSLWARHAAVLDGDAAPHDV